MVARDELHRVVDELADDRVPVALANLRALIDGDVPIDERPSGDPLEQRMGPLTMAGHRFVAAPSVDLPVLAAQQGMEPATNLEDIVGEFWPDDESVDDFIAAVRRWRHEDGYA